MANRVMRCNIEKSYLEQGVLYPIEEGQEIIKDIDTTILIVYELKTYIAEVRKVKDTGREIYFKELKSLGLEIGDTIKLVEITNNIYALKK